MPTGVDRDRRGDRRGRRVATPAAYPTAPRSGISPASVQVSPTSSATQPMIAGASRIPLYVMVPNLATIAATPAPSEPPPSASPPRAPPPWAPLFWTPPRSAPRWPTIPNSTGSGVARPSPTTAKPTMPSAAHGLSATTASPPAAVRAPARSRRAADPWASSRSPTSRPAVWQPVKPT
jgi:hypothetical protein